MELPRQQKAPRFLREDECANFWPACPEFSGGCRPAWALVRCHALCPWGSTLPGRRIKRLEIGEPFRVGDRSVRQERRRLRDRLSDDRMLRIYSKGFLENVTIEELTPYFMSSGCKARYTVRRCSIFCNAPISYLYLHFLYHL